MAMSLTKLRWLIWWRLAKVPGICPANAHSLIIDGCRRDPRIDAICRDICPPQTACWCGKIRGGQPAGQEAPAVPRA